MLALSWLAPARAQTSDPHVHVVWADTGDAGDPCHTGDAFATVIPPATATAVACVLSSDETPVETSASELTLDWSVEGPATFTAAPVTETDQSGTATVDLYVPDDGTSDVLVSLCSDPACMTVLSTDTATLITTTGPHLPECNDGSDNDGDMQTDFPDDKGCSSENDNTENTDGCCDYGTPTACEGLGGDVLVGTHGADVLVGTDRRDCIFGGGGTDTIEGRGGADLLVGGGMDDTIYGNGGADKLRGSKGSDRLRGGLGVDLLRGNDGNDDLSGDRGHDHLYGGSGRDTCSGESISGCE